ncbi:MAG TPA: hypothetical protein PLF32_02275 [Bacteroidales bacterium]|nr:hypothetical protein [Bacteroidales bacterium]HOR81467.1 hypothetical protein [Bacteroidales bacterium]HPJ90642.1 hypothetical protein [Bacteroidales bacterium]
MEIKIKKNINWGILIMLCICELFILFFIFIWTYAAIMEIIFDKKISDFLIVSVVLILVSLFVLDLILWQIKGYEFIEMNEKTLTIRKKGKIFNIPEKINLTQINDIHLENYKATFFTLFFKIMDIEGGKICIDSSDGRIYMGQSLTDKEALRYINEMNEFLSSHVNNIG